MAGFCRSCGNNGIWTSNKQHFHVIKLQRESNAQNLAFEEYCVVFGKDIAFNDTFHEFEKNDNKKKGFYWENIDAAISTERL